MRPFITPALLVALLLGTGTAVPQETKVTVGLSFSVEEYDPSTPSKAVMKCTVRNKTDKALLKEGVNKKANKSDEPSIVFDNRPEAGVPPEALAQEAALMHAKRPAKEEPLRGQHKLHEITDGTIKTVRIRYFNKDSWATEEQAREYVRGYLAHKSLDAYGSQIWSQGVGVPEIECVIEYSNQCLKKLRKAGKPGYFEGRLLIWNTESCFRDISGRWWFVSLFDHFHRSHPKGDRAYYKEGVWILQGPRNIVGAGRDTVVTLEKKHSKCLISFRHIQHFSVNDNKPPQETVAGPYEISVAGPVLEYQGPNGDEKISYRFDGDSLVMPAVVRLDERTWMMQTTSTLYDPAKKAKTTRPGKYLWRCQSDPTKIDQGEAEFPPYGRQEGASKGQYTYIFSQEKDKAGRTISILRFLAASKDKKDATESCRLTWDTEGAIQIEARSLPPEWHQRTYSLK